MSDLIAKFMDYCKRTKFSDTKNIAVITLQFSKILTIWSYSRRMSFKDADGIANSEDLQEQSDLGLHCLLRPACPKT